MLDVKITGYIVPVAEQPQASLTPVIAVANIADEGAVITGLIRIYRESTGLMIYSSELAVTQLEHHSTTNIAALTPFDPPAPADDDYFVKADITATSYLPGPPTHDSLGAWYFDIKTPPMGEAPAGHAVTHELGGSDPVDVTGLDGNPDPHAASHADGGSDELSHGDLEGLADDDHPQYQRVLAQTLADGANIDWDLNLGGNAKVTLGGNRTLNNPTNLVAGAHDTLRVIQDATGTRTLTYGALYLWPGDVAPTLTATANATDILVFLCDGTSMLCIGATFDVK